MLPAVSPLNKLSYHFVNLGLKMMGKPIRAFRQNNHLPERHLQMDLPSIYGISHYFLEKPSDYPKNAHYTGFWLDKTENLDDDVYRFLNEGSPPLLVTFGSMPYETKMNFLSSINRITTEFNTRVIVVKGWGRYDMAEWTQNPMVKLIPSASYYALLPHIKAAIHHGGIGTISYCLQAGKPFLTCPVIYPFGDQHFWGSIAWKKGIGLKPIPLKYLTEEKLIAQVENLLGNDSLYSNAAKMAEHLQSENGVINAIELLEKM
jgi:sterol 3beta-glucosyltransferase